MYVRPCLGRRPVGSATLDGSRSDTWSVYRGTSLSPPPLPPQTQLRLLDSLADLRRIPTHPHPPRPPRGPRRPISIPHGHTLVVFVFVFCCRLAHPGGLAVRSRAAMERYEVIRDIGSGNFGVAKLVRDVSTNELFAVKFIERGQMVTANYRPFLVPSSPQRSSFFFLSLPSWSLVLGASARQGIAGVLEL